MPGIFLRFVGIDSQSLDETEAKVEVLRLSNLHIVRIAMWQNSLHWVGWGFLSVERLPKTKKKALESKYGKRKLE